MTNGLGWGGMADDGGIGGNDVGVGKQGRGLSRNGSTILRYVVNTSGNSVMSLRGTSSLVC
jgi:hypothetical protein